MPIKKRWLEINQKNIKSVPKSLGVYELGSRFGNVIYVGRSRNLWERLNSILTNEDPCFLKACFFRYELISGERNCCLREKELLIECAHQQGKLPICNNKVPNCKEL